MWNFASKAISGAIRLKNDALKPSQVSSELSDDDASLNNSREEGLECPICWESFNVVENLPYVLWCGHTLCKNCVLGLQRAVIRLPTLPFQLPFFITCPWCNMVSLRLICKGNLRFPQKNYYLLWMVESMNGDRSKSNPHFRGDHQPASSLNRNSAVRNQVSHAHNGRATCSHVSRQSEIRRDEGRFLTGHLNAERLQLSLRKSLVFFAQLTAKFPLIIVLILIILYAIPASAAILALYILITIVFAIPSCLVLYFALPILDWLVREIIAWLPSVLPLVPDNGLTPVNQLMVQFDDFSWLFGLAMFLLWISSGVFFSVSVFVFVCVRTYTHSHTHTNTQAELLQEYKYIVDFSSLLNFHGLVARVCLIEGQG